MSQASDPAPVVRTEFMIKPGRDVGTVREVCRRFPAVEPMADADSAYSGRGAVLMEDAPGVGYRLDMDFIDKITPRKETTD